MKVGVLTSSRADFGIYRPLLKLWINDPEISFEIIAFGQHLISSFGNTVNEIEREGFIVNHKVHSEYLNDTPHGIAMNFANTLKEFVSFWNDNQFDFVLALGDRYEMAAAVEAGIPFQVRFAHLHAGEKTMGAIDEIYRHQITLASDLHFVSLLEYAERVHKIIDKTSTTCISGAIGLENLKSIHFFNTDEFFEKWEIDLTIPTLFFIFHPETRNYSENFTHVEIIKEVCIELMNDFQIVVSLPNSDTNGSIYREMWNNLSEKFTQIKLIEHFGSQSFFSCMKHSKLIIGNSSSGIIEAASFKKYVLNLGIRQLGRVSGKNVIHLPINKHEILSSVYKYAEMQFVGENIYELDDGIRLISEKLKHSVSTDE
jgi:GDP/UDP-N,N'-diacetylbacillosamine 2-epimerase (hydrolysing)